MLKRTNKIDILHLCLKNKDFCLELSKIMSTITPDPGKSPDSLEKLCKSISETFSSLGTDFETIVKLTAKDFTKKEIKTISASS